MKVSPKTAFQGFGRAAVPTLGICFWAQCSPDDTEAGVNAKSAEIEAIQAQLESTRKERDSLLEKLDESTRARVELDGEISRLRRKLKALEAEPEPKAENSEPRSTEAP